jgi:hypothetical protein
MKVKEGAMLSFLHIFVYTFVLFVVLIEVVLHDHNKRIYYIHNIKIMLPKNKKIKN